MAYRSFPSSFDTIIARMRKVDIRNADAVARGIADVRRMLFERVREETAGTGDMSPRWARLRIEGSVQELRRLELQASGHHAPPDFIALLRHVREEAHAAWERAPQVATASSATPVEQPDEQWVTEPIFEPVSDGTRLCVVALDFEDI